MPAVIQGRRVTASGGWGTAQVNPQKTISVENSIFAIRRFAGCAAEAAAAGGRGRGRMVFF